MAVRKFKPVTPGQRLVRSRKLLHPYQRSLSFAVSVLPAVETIQER